jgi:hypothetical protein
MKAVLVYQVGIANVFKVDRFSRRPERRGATRLLQLDFRSCAWFARGLAAAGAEVRTAHADVAGDIRNVPWSPGKGDLWADKKSTVITRRKAAK